MRAWLFTILRNLYINHLRYVARRPSESSLENRNQLEPETQATQEQGLVLQEMSTALELLHSQHREVILLIGLEGMSYKETAKILDVPLGTVMSRLSRGRDALKSLIGTGNRRDKPSLWRVK